MHDRTKDGMNNPPERLRPKGAPLIKEVMQEPDYMTEKQTIYHEGFYEGKKSCHTEIERLRKALEDIRYNAQELIKRSKSSRVRLIKEIAQQELKGR